MIAPVSVSSELARLRAVAEKATPGEWEWWRNPENLGEDGVHAKQHPNAKRNDAGDIIDAVTICRGMTGANREANAEYIAELSPSVILSLLDRLEGLEADARRMDWLAKHHCVAWRWGHLEASAVVAGGHFAKQATASASTLREAIDAASTPTEGQASG